MQNPAPIVEKRGTVLCKLVPFLLRRLRAKGDDASTSRRCLPDKGINDSHVKFGFIKIIGEGHSNDPTADNHKFFIVEDSFG